MDNQKLVKFIVFIVAVFLATPFLMKLIPEPMSFERARAGFEKAGLAVSDFALAPNPGQRAVAEAGMLVNGVNVSIFQFDNEGKISTAMEYQKKDAGTAIVETMGLAQSLGAAVRKETPSRAVRRGMFMMVATGQDREMVNRIADVFERI